MTARRTSKHLFVTRLTFLVAGISCMACDWAGPAGAAEAGAAFDAAPFASAIDDAGGQSHGLRWEEPRKIRRVVVEFGAGEAPASPAGVKLQYWHRAWDGRPDPVLRERGAGGVGWDAMDDWTNGQWKEADAELQVDGDRWTYTFRPTGAREFERLGHPGVTYRKTLKLRLVSEQAMPRPKRIETLTDARYRPLTVRIHLGEPAEKKIRTGPDESVTLEAFNGVVVSSRPLEAANPGAGLEAHILMAVDPSDGRYDRTVVTVRSKYRPFSFAADEVARGDRILVDDLGALVVRGDDPITLESCRKARAESAGKTVYDRVFDEAEQTLTRAWDDMPLKRPLYFVHGLPGDRNNMRQLADGTIMIMGKGRWFNIGKSAKDSERKLWAAPEYTLTFGFPREELRGGRELQDGYLPLLRTWWQDGPLYYEQRTILDKLDGDLKSVRLDDPTVLLMRVRVVNTSATETSSARLSLRAPAADGERLYAQGSRVLADYQGTPRLRLLLKAGAGEDVSSGDQGVEWSRPLKPGEACQVDLVIPSITLSTEEEIAAAEARDFEADARRVCRYWQELTAKGTKIITPEPWLNDFYRAHARHLLVNCYQELDSERLHAHVGTFYYGVYPNESVMMISDLDRRGYHDAARRNLDMFLHYQSTVKFLGTYTGQEGLFYGANGSEDGNYNKSHGYVLWAMAHHWQMTHDRAWMERAAPKLVKACDWIVRERKATMQTNEDGSRPIEYGFLPPGSLEDVTDFWHWLATNTATVWGFDALAEALADFGHPDAARLQAEARAYHEDVMRGLTEARILAPVVRLRDGTYVPKYPSRLYERGRSHGWLRETLEGAIFLLHYRLIPPDAPEAKWILKDYEDNLYISDTYGYAIPAFDRFWFSRGGFSMQAQLLDGPPPYLYRDEIKHYLRAYFNGFASAFYPEIRMCNEHSLPELGYPVGDHFKSSDEAQSTFWLRLMFVHEDGDDLHLGRAIPRSWLDHGRTVGIEEAPTFFGPVSWMMTSNARNNEIKATLTPPPRNPPKTIYLRFRHPEGKPMQAVTVNGRPHDSFDAGKEWVVLPGSLQGPQEIVARYEAARR